MGRTASVSALLAAAAVVTASCDRDGSGSGTAATRTDRAATPQSAFDRDSRGCRSLSLPVSRRELPGRFFPLSARGLWAPSAGKGCVYLLPARSAAAKGIWRPPADERIRGVGWAPSGDTFAVTTESPSGWHVYVVGADGRTRRRVAAQGAAFLANGELVIARRDGLSLAAGNEVRLVAAHAETRRAAGFSATSPLFVGEDRHGFQRGYGRREVVVPWQRQREGGFRQATLVVSTDGFVRRLGARSGASAVGVVGGRAWSPDGEALLLVVGELPSPPGWKHGHDHCVDRWDESGYRRLTCGSSFPAGPRWHFDRLVWSMDGAAVLLNDGTMLAADGSFRGRSRVPAVAFEVHWTHERR